MRDWRGGKWEEQKVFRDFCRRESQEQMYNVNLSVILRKGREHMRARDSHWREVEASGPKCKQQEVRYIKERSGEFIYG